MSLGYLELKRRFVSDTQASYDVLSADFSTVPGQAAHVGVLTIDHRLKTRSFEPAGELRDVKIVPLDVFDRASAEVEELLAGKYAGFGAPKMVRRLAAVSKGFIDRGESPERYPQG